MDDIVDALRTYQQTTRLEESRSRVGGHLLTLPGPATYRDLVDPPPADETPVRVASPARSAPRLAVQYTAQKAPSVSRSQRSRVTATSSAKPPLVTPVSPPASSRGSRRSAVRNNVISRGVTEEQESEASSIAALNGAQEMLAEAQHNLDFEQRVLDEAQNRLNDLSEALHNVDNKSALGLEDSEPGDPESLILNEVADAMDSIRDASSIKQHKQSTPPTQDDPVGPRRADK